MSSPTTGLKKRDTAFKLPIVELSAGNEVEDSTGGKAFTTQLGTFRRVRVLGVVLNKYSSEKEGKKPYTSLTLDDGSAQIRIKGWGADAKRLTQFEVGMTLDVIGRIRSSDEDTYLTSELEVQITDPTWELVRRMELIKQYEDRGIKPAVLPLSDQSIPFMRQQPPSSVELPYNDSQFDEPVQTPQNTKSQTAPMNNESGNVQEKIKDKLIVTIKQLDSGKGASYDDLLKQIGDVSEQVFEETLMDLLKEGVAYEPSPARYKILK